MDQADVKAKSAGIIVLAFVFSSTMVGLAYFAIAPLVAVVFSTGFFGGFALWLARPQHTSFQAIKVPYILSLIAYAIHRTEEELSGFVPAIEELAGQTAADVTSPVSIAIVVASIIWILTPLLVRGGHGFGFYGAWTMFAGFGVLELAHLVFPLLTPEPYGYFPGMLTVPIVVAVGWWGMWRLWRGDAPVGSSSETTAPTATDPTQ